jgi:hypothetical protein
LNEETKQFAARRLSCAKGASENSPQFQLRACGSKRIRPNGTVEGGWICLEIFSRPGGACSACRSNPAVETAGYFQFVPAGRKKLSRHPAINRELFRAGLFIRPHEKRMCQKKRIHASASDGEDMKSFWLKHEENESRKP